MSEAPPGTGTAEPPEAAEANAPSPLGLRATGHRLVDSIDVALRRPHRWPAGFCYQFLALGWAFGVYAAIPILGKAMPGATRYGEGLEGLRTGAFFDRLTAEDWAGGSLFLLLLSLRLAPGLARSFQLGGGHSPDERTFESGRGLGLPAAVVWSQVVVTMVAASALAVAALSVVVAVLGLDPGGPLPKMGAGVLLAFLLAYGATLGALYHLALASLVRHQRGVGSALLHAWRLVRSQPEAAARAIVVDTLLVATVTYLQWIVPRTMDVHWLMTTSVSLAVLAVCGLTRAGFWSRTYSALGGVNPV